jgi:sorbitol-specific phosphotransferase system component IIBC
MIVSKVQKQPKLNKVVIIGPQNVPAKPAKTAASAQRVKATQRQISERAFEIFEKRGSQHGHDVQDWFHAERQTLAQ